MFYNTVAERGNRSSKEILSVELRGLDSDGERKAATSRASFMREQLWFLGSKFRNVEVKGHPPRR